MAAGMEVTKVYASVEPKLVNNFVSSLNAQIKKAMTGKTYDADVKLDVDVDSDTTRAKRTIKKTFGDLEKQVNVETIKWNKSRSKKKGINPFGDGKSSNLFSFTKALFKGGESAGSGLAAFANTAEAASESAVGLGKQLNNFGSLGAAFGIVIQGMAKQVSGLSSAAAGGETAMGGMLAAIGEGAATAGITVIIGILSAGVLALAGAFLAGTAAAAGMIVISVLLGAALSTLAAGIGAVGSAALAVVPGLFALTAILGVLLAALMPVVGAFQDFMTAENGAPPAIGKTTKAIKSQQAAAVQYALAQKQASQAVKDAYFRQTQARKDLTKAEQAALKTIRDLKREVEGAADDEEAATLRLIDARNAVNALNPHSVDPEAILEYRKALLEEREAERNLKYTKEDNIDLQKKYDDVKKKGVAGDERVIEANERLASSIRDVQRARDAQKVAALRPDPSATPAIADPSAVRKAAASFGELTKAGQGFVDILKKGRGFLQGISDIAQNTILPAMTTSATALAPFGKLIKNFTADVGRSIGRFVTTVVNFLSDPKMQALIKQVMDVLSVGVGAILSGLGAGLKPLLTGLFTFLANSGPMFSALGFAFQLIGEHLGTFFQILGQPAVMEAFSSILVSMTEFFGLAAGKLAEFLAAVAPIIAQILPKLNGAFLFLVESVLKVLVALMAGGAMDGFVTFMNALSQVILLMVNSGMMKQFSDIMGEILTQLGGLFIQAMTTLIPMLPELFDGLLKITTMFIEMLPAVMELLPELTEFVYLITTELLPYMPLIIAVMVTFMKIINLLTGVFFALLTPIKLVFTWLQTVKNAIAVGLVHAIKTSVGVIQTWWGKLKGIFSDPIKFMVNTVYNGGIRGVVNPIARLAGLPELPEVKGFANGGHVKGQGTGTSDSIMAMLSNGEFVIPAWLVKKFGVGFFESLRQGQMPGFAGGGLLDKIKGMGSSAINKAKGLAGSLSGIVPSIPGGPFGKMLEEMLKNLLAKITSFGIFDNGGVLPAGGMALNLSGKPEAVMTARQFKNQGNGNGGGLTSVSRIVNMDVSVRDEGDIQILARKINSDI